MLNKPIQVSRLHAELNKALQESKKEFFDDKLSRFLRTSPKKFWGYFSGKKEEVQETKKDQLLVNKKDIADNFNHFFQSVFTTTDDDVDVTLEGTVPSQIDDIIITQEGAFQQLLSLDAKKANGPDGIPTQFLQRYAE